MTTESQEIYVGQVERIEDALVNFFAPRFAQALSTYFRRIAANPGDPFVMRSAGNDFELTVRSILQDLYERTGDAFIRLEFERRNEKSSAKTIVRKNEGNARQRFSAWVSENISRQARQIRGTLQRRTQNILQSGRDQARIAAELIRRAREAGRVSRLWSGTEVSRARNRAAWISANKSDRNFATKTWVTVGDDRVRPAHQALQGRTIPFGDFFSVGGFSARYPQDDSLPLGKSINCRCVLVFNE